MKTKGKVLALVLSAAALVAVSVFGTMAYLTDNESVTNTFTVGKVGLTLDETDVDDSTIDKARDTENEYHLLPGHTYTKDPTVHIDTDSESCWVFVKVENGLVKNNVNIEAKTENTENGYKTVADQITGNDWTQLKADDDSEVAGVYYMQWTKPTGEVIDTYYDLLVFEEFKIDGDSVTNTTLSAFAEAEIVVTAYAVQLDGFEGEPYSAWTAANFE